jgi:hypothetical protein
VKRQFQLVRRKEFIEPLSAASKHNRPQAQLSTLSAGRNAVEMGLERVCHRPFTIVKARKVFISVNSRSTRIRDLLNLLKNPVFRAYLEAFDLSLPENSIYRGGWDVEECASDVRLAQAASVENCWSYRALLTVGELVEERIGLQASKSKSHYGHYLSHWHNGQR